MCAVQVSSWAIKDGRCFYRNRYVRTDAFMAEQEAGRMLFKGAFSRGDPAGEHGLLSSLERAWGGVLFKYSKDLGLTLVEITVCEHCILEQLSSHNERVVCRWRLLQPIQSGDQADSQHQRPALGRTHLCPP